MLKECSLCSSYLDPRGMKAHQAGGFCKVEQAKKELSAQGFAFLGTHKDFGLATLGIEIRLAPYLHHSGGFGRKSHTLYGYYAPGWAVLLTKHGASVAKLELARDNPEERAIMIAEAELNVG